MRLIKISAEELAEKLKNYLNNDADFKIIYDYTKQRYADTPELTAHNWAHTHRDIINTIVIGEAEGADMRIALPATTMHDIGFLYGSPSKVHGEVGAEKLEDYVSQTKAHYSNKELQKIASCIKTHKGSMRGKHPESLEAKVVADADLLDKFGPFGIYQKARVYGEFNRDIQKIIAEGKDTANFTMQTATGQKLAEPGRQMVIDFFKSLEEANQPYSIDV